MNTDCRHARVSFQVPGNAHPRRVEADFSGGTILSNAGLMLAGLANMNTNMFRRFADCFDDHRSHELIVHKVETRVGQRIAGRPRGSL